MSPIDFCKFHGFGNDYIVIERENIDAAVSLPDFAKSICHRHTGAGADGIAVLERLDGSEADYFCEIVNPDGSYAGFSGNGMTYASVASLLFSDILQNKRNPYQKIYDPTRIPTIKQLAKKAKELNLEVLLEIHSEEEIGFICDEVDIIGISNRNLETFVTDIKTSMQLIEFLPADKPVISESGINDIDTIIALHNVGFKGFLIGEAFMKTTKPAIAFADFMEQLKAKTK